MLFQRAGFRIVARDVAALQILLSTPMLASAGVAALYAEWYSALGLGLGAAISAGLGYLVYRLAGVCGQPRNYHAMAIAGAGWLFGALFGAVPLVLAAYLTPDDVAQAFVPAGETYRSSLANFENPLHAFFESMSCYTTTGLTMTEHEPSIGHGLLFYRVAMAWLGGAGMIVLGLAIIPRPGQAGGMHLWATEQAGSKLRPSILGTARAIWKIYVLATVALTVYLALALLILEPDFSLAERFYLAVYHAMAGLSSGGISSLDNGPMDFDSYALELVLLVPMLGAAIPLPLLYLATNNRDLQCLRRDVQVRALFGVLALGIPLTCLVLWADPTVDAPIREGVFQFVSAVTTTGWQTSNTGAWRDPGILLAWGAMFVGGAAASTAGGIKLARAYLIFCAAAWRIKRVFLPPQAIVPFKVGERIIPSQEVQREVADAAVFTFLYFVLLVVGMLVTAHFVGPEHTLADVMFEGVSAQSNCGLSSGITNPNMPVAIEVTYILQMWIGRIEIFAVIIFIRALFVWHRRQEARF